ncbi:PLASMODESMATA CALLOSE-BINDING PROTEIN 3-like [Prosopis cineraria]|uniref:PLASMODESMATA CALLOSE-BINDING PROTEIN 3-like n=1 Tax=Prosopis cineraria TaxID=364024 RepID=UPI00241096B4|nr:PLASMODESMATA CALLOSE-BINDING PROTEIN 3-like [Prosopis cineraria]
MASLLLPLAMTLLASIPLSSGNWCVCKDGSDAVLQKTLDYACGAGADCNPIRQNGPCFQPNTVRAHCNYAVNSYFQRRSQSQGSCDFAGTATLTASNPSTSGCVYPSTATNAGNTSPTATTPSTGSTSSTTTGSTMPSSSTTTTATPYSATPGVFGGIGSGGIGPSAAGMNSDDSHGGLRLVDACFHSCVSALLLSHLFMIQLWRG